MSVTTPLLNANQLVLMLLNNSGCSIPPDPTSVGHVLIRQVHPVRHEVLRHIVRTKRWLNIRVAQPKVGPAQLGVQQANFQGTLRVCIYIYMYVYVYTWIFQRPKNSGSFGY